MNEQKVQTAPTIAAIIKAVCEEYNCEKRDLLDRSRHRGIERPRQVAHYLATELTILSNTQIGMHFKRDHTTIISNRRRLKWHLERDPILVARVYRITKSIPGHSSVDEQIKDIQKEMMKDLPYAMGNLLRIALLRLPNSDPQIVMREVSDTIERIKAAHNG